MSDTKIIVDGVVFIFELIIIIVAVLIAFAMGIEVLKQGIEKIDAEARQELRRRRREEKELIIEFEIDEEPAPTKKKVRK
jgi:predicted Holliday junction resolvase-like endonuclease